jgi:hypothetical protein
MFKYFLTILIFQQIFMTSFGLSKKKKPNPCESYMNNKTLSDTSSQWECLIIGTRRPKANPNKNRQTKLIGCICSTIQTCHDNEEFILESDLIDKEEYVKLKFAFGENFYTKQCVDGLKALTAETDSWKCELQHDRIEVNEFYCNCKREMTCKKQKSLKISIPI